MRLRLKSETGRLGGGDGPFTSRPNLRWRTPATRFDFAMLADNPSRLVATPDRWH